MTAALQLFSIKFDFSAANRIGDTAHVHNIRDLDFRQKPVQ